MDYCPNCNKKLGIFKTGIIYRFDGKRFCTVKCKNEYKDKNVFVDSKVKTQLLNDLRKKQAERELELKINNKKKTKEDLQREQKIKHLEEELRIPTSTKVMGGGVLGGMALSMGGVGMMIIGAILTFTIIGAIIGIPLLIIGFIMFLGSGFVAGGGLLGGLIIRIKEKLSKNKK